jgi:hypothetical protein
MSVLTEPKKTFSEFSEWFSKEPTWHKMQIENVTCRDLGSVSKSIIGNKCRMIDIYNHWYLVRHLGA